MIDIVIMGNLKEFEIVPPCLQIMELPMSVSVGDLEYIRCPNLWATECPSIQIIFLKGFL